MVRPRQSHVSKTQAERRRYFQEVIQPRPVGPTLDDDEPIIDTTDQTAPTKKAEPAAYALTKPPSAILRFLRDKGIELMIAVILAVLGWGAYQLYTINREVGQFESDLNNMQKAQLQLDSEIEKMEQRVVGRIQGVSSDVDRLERRIDGLIDSGLQKRK